MALREMEFHKTATVESHEINRSHVSSRVYRASLRRTGDSGFKAAGGTGLFHGPLLAVL